MVTAALFAGGTLLKVDDGAGNYTTIAEVLSISGPSIQAAVLDVTSQDSTGGYREFIAGLIDAGSLTFDINHQPATATHGNSTGLLYLLNNRIKRNFKITFTDAGPTSWIFPCRVVKLSDSIPVDGALKASVELRIVGIPTFA